MGDASARRISLEGDALTADAGTSSEGMTTNNNKGYEPVN